jgi:GTP-binding protein
MSKNKIAIIGRSNVGKSSLINYVLQIQQAKTSKHPGRTRKHEIYNFNEWIDLVDMPGYGYAKLSKERRDMWDELMLKLFFNDKDFREVFVLIDLSIKPTKIDQDFVAWLYEHQIKHNIIFTKIDKESQREVNGFKGLWDEIFIEIYQNAIPRTFMTSTNKKIGREEIITYLKHLTLEPKLG